jgi:hypothetical protein
LTV